MERLIRSTTQPNSTSKPPGRPRKRVGTSRPNAGRPLKKLRVLQNDGAHTDEKVADKTIHRRAKRLIQDPLLNKEVLLKALQLLENNDEMESEEDEDIDMEEVQFGTVPHSPESALAFFIEHNYKVNAYKALVKDSKLRTKGMKPIYPSYYFIEKEKKKCLEGLDYTIQNENVVQCSFQSMLNKSSEKLIKSIGQNWDNDKLAGLKLFVSYGFDSSAGHKNPHQGFEDEENETLSPYMSLFATVCVILAVADKDDNLLWLNPSPQSVRYCRPLRLSFEKETPEAIRQERDRLRDEVDNFVPHNFSLTNGKNVGISFNAELTLVDGKCLNNILANDCTTRCPLCNIHMKKFNTYEDWHAPVPSDESLSHGLGLLHCEIKCFEFCLHLAYKKTLNLKSWDCPKPLKRKLFETSFKTLDAEQQQRFYLLSQLFFFLCFL